MRRLFAVAAAICSLLVMLTGCSVAVQDSSKTGVAATIGLRSSQGSGIVCEVCGNEIEMKDADDTYGITFLQRSAAAVLVERAYQEVCPDCAENIVEYIEKLRRKP